jgi:hypothetical protein
MLAILFSILVLGASLLRGKRRLLAVAVVVIGAAAAVSLFARRQPVLREASGGVVVLTDELVQTDVWSYQTSTRAATAMVAWNGLTRPMPVSIEHARDFAMELICREDGGPLVFMLHPSNGRVMCFYTSGVNPRTPELMPIATTSSPLRALAPYFYTGVGARLVGEGPAQPRSTAYSERWPTVILDRRVTP